LAPGDAHSRDAGDALITRLEWRGYQDALSALAVGRGRLAQSAAGKRPVVTCHLGNIVRQPDCDAIVNSANQNLRAGSGVCGAIYRAAGPRLEPCSHALAPLDLGGAVATPAFQLPNRMVIHARGPKYQFDEHPAEYLAAALWSALRLADANHAARVAVPAISMGVYAYPADEAVQILVDTASICRGLLTNIDEIRFVVLDEALQRLFGRELAAIG
jgi:O-acetyl-ADP-ribose deacetylase (regulator of RNase III)